MKNAKKAAVKQRSPSAGLVLSTAAAASLLGITAERIGQLVKTGWIARSGRNSYPLDKLVRGYIRYLTDEARRTSKSAAASRVQDARAREIELRVGREQNQLIEIEDVEALLSDIVGAFRSELSGVPAACTRDLTQRAEIEKQLNAAIDRCRKGFEVASQTVRSGRGLVAGSEEADA